MLYLVRKENLKDPMILAMLRKELGETYEDNVFCELARNDSWDAVSARNPGHPWRHMSELYGKAKTKVALICGSGESLKELPETLPAHVTTFAVNRAILRVKADYFACHDTDAWKTYRDHPNVKSAEKLICVQVYTDLKDTPCTLIEVAGEPMRWRKPERRPLYWAESTTGWVIHLAIRMGFEKILLIGMDYPGGGMYDGFVQDGKTRDWQIGQHFGVMERLLGMFSDSEKPQWYERPVEIIDTTPRGYLPVATLPIVEALR